MTARRVEVLDVAERRLVRPRVRHSRGPVQDVAALLADLRLVKERLGDVAPAAAALGDLETRLRVLHQELRDLAQSLESRALVDRDLREVLESDAAAFRRRCDTELDLEITGDLDSSRHPSGPPRRGSPRRRSPTSGSTAAPLTRGCASTRTTGRSRSRSGRRRRIRCAAQPCPQQGRLGLVGMRERTRLLHGHLLVDSRPGGPTAIEATAAALASGCRAAA